MKDEVLQQFLHIVEKALSQKVMCLCHQKPEQWTSLFCISIVESSSKFAKLAHH
jgi:hypothetical protein